MSDLLTEGVRQVIHDEYLPLIERLQEDIAMLKSEDKFISYPSGLEEYLGKSYHGVYRMWNKRDFPRSENGNVKGVFLHDLKRWLKRERV